MGTWGGEDTWQGSSWQIRQLADWLVPHLHVDKLGGTTGNIDHTTQDSSKGKIKPQNFWLQKPLGVVAVGEIASLLKAGRKMSKQHCSLSDHCVTYSTTSW